MKVIKNVKLVVLGMILLFQLGLTNVYANNDFSMNEIYLPKEEEGVGLGLLWERTSFPSIPTTNNVTYKTSEAGKWVWPTDQYYPVICVYLCYKNHHAIDIYAEVGTPIYASRDGVVQQALSSCPNMIKNKKECGGGYGNYITIKHANGVYSRYAHLDTVSVKVGQKVTAGQKIATMGTSGRVGAVHLHFEIRQNTKGMATGGWNPLDKERFYYILPNEVKSSKVGWQKIDNKWYFYQNGELKTGWLKEADKSYYLDNSGVMKTGWIKDLNKWYYLDNSGVMKTGWIKDLNKWYYLGDDGVMQVGWLEEDDDEWYYLNSDGSMQVDWKLINNKWYYFYSSGKMATNTIIDNWIIDSTGVAKELPKQTIGWVKDNHGTYFLENNKYVTKWKLIDDKWYYFYQSGKMATNTIIDNWVIDSTGVATDLKYHPNGWLLLGNDWYYRRNGHIVTGWLKDSSKWYYLNNDGKMLSNEWIRLSGKSYYLTSGGEMATGWMKHNNQWYYLYSSGVMATAGVVDGWQITSSGMAYRIGEVNPDYVVNKGISRLKKLGYKLNVNLNSSNAKQVIIKGTPGYEEALTEACVVKIIENNAKEFNIYTDKNNAYVFYK